MRIVSLVPSITEALTQLGRADDIVAVTDYCIHPADVVKDKPKIGGTKNPDLDAIGALKPDLVIANTDEQRAATLAELEGRPYDVLVTETDSLDEAAETWTQLGRATGAEDAAAAQHARLEEAIKRARESSNTGRRLATLVPVWRNPWMATGGRTYLGDLLATCGFDNVFADHDEKWLLFHPTTDPADAARHAPTSGPNKGRNVHAVPTRPDCVLLPTEPYAFSDADRDAFTRLDVPRERVRVVDGELLTWWLARSVDALDHFSALHAAWDGH